MPATWFERLTPLDNLFLDLEDRSSHMHVGALALFDGPAPPYRDLLALIEARLEHVPRYRQRLMTVPLGQGRPVWVDEGQFDLEYHVRHTALPAPGGPAELRKLVGRLLSQALDRDKPLWELYLVEGLGDGRFALVSKTHHCMLDGMAGVDLATLLLDPDPEQTRPPEATPWTPRPAPGVAELMAASMREQFAHPVRLAKEALEAPPESRKIWRDLSAGLRPLLGLAQMGQAPASGLNVPIGPHRRFEPVELDLAQLRRIRARLGGTINDGVLALVAGALRTWLQGRGEAVGADLRVLVPVSVRTADSRGAMGNQISAVFCALPVGEPDAVERHRRIGMSMRSLKENGQALGAQVLMKLGDFAPPTLLAQAARLQARTRFFNLVVTNVPGPQFPLHLLGRRMQACFPQVPLAAQQAVGIALLSYDGKLCVGLLGDADAARDLDGLGKALKDAMAELLGRAEAHEAQAGDAGKPHETAPGATAAPTAPTGAA